MPEKKSLLTIKEVAQKLKIAVGTAYNMASQRRLPRVKIGGALRFDPDQIDALIESRSTKAKETH